MQENGVIQANISVVNPLKVGFGITIIVEVELEREHAGLIDVTKKNFVNAPEVQQCYYITGEADFILIVTAANMGEYETMTRRLFFENPNIKRFRTFVAMDRVKVGLSVPILDREI
jgi:DNA-binding Lrp family transcriptional regulator